MDRCHAGVVRPAAGWLAVCATALVACTGPENLSQAGFAETTTTLTLGLADQPGRYSWTLAEQFAERVSAATSGSLRVEITNAGSPIPDRWNQALAERAQSGEVDLALVQAQAWDDLDVTSVSALHIPFLITDEEVLDAVATSDIADDLLAGLDGTGVTGLGLIPGGMRRLVTSTDPPRTPADIAGEGVRSGYSEVVWAIIEAAGGRPDGANGEEMDRRLRTGQITVVDSTFALSDGFLNDPAVAGDLSLYPHAFTLVIHDGAMRALTSSDQDAVREAAREVTHFAARTRPSEAAEARDLCQRNPGAQVVLAGPEALAQWHAATSDIAARMRSDATIDDLARRIEQIRASTGPAEPIKACRGAGPTTTTSAPPNVPAEFPEGVYRKEVTAQELIDLGVNSSVAHDHAGTWTMDFDNGVFVDPLCLGSSYEVVDDRLVVTMGPGPSCGDTAGQVLFSGGWQLEGGSLTFTDVRSGHGGDLLIRGLFGGAPWTKIG